MTTIKNARRSALFSRFFGSNVAWLREVVAAALIKGGVKPNTLTFLGLFFTLIAAVFLARGAGDKIAAAPYHSWFGFVAALFLILASACDILDGAVARNAKQITRLGGFLDSTLDRFADGLIFIGIMIYYIRRPDIPYHRLFAALGMVALVNAQMISYVKARAENIIDNCTVGYWQRSERIAAVLLGLFSGHIATVLCVLAVLPPFTVLRRIIYTSQQIKRLDNNQPPLQPYPPLQGLKRLALWRYRRDTWQYELIAALLIAFILLLDIQKLLDR